MEFWQVISWCETGHIVPVARKAEELGFTGLILAEHIYYPQQTASRYYYSEDGQSPQTADMEFPEPLISFAAAAAATTHLRFMTGIYILPLRDPIELAKNIATLTRLSNNRFQLGFGAGWLQEEFEQLGVDFHTRGKRCDEMLTVMEQLWQGEPVTYRGEFFSLDNIRINPFPDKPVPLIGGGHSPPALKRAVERCDGWYGPGNTLDQLRELVPSLLAQRRAYTDKRLEVIAPLLEPLTKPTLQTLSDLGVTGTVNYPFLYGCGPDASLKEKFAYMEDFAATVIDPLGSAQ